jgi:hypothetical protein
MISAKPVMLFALILGALLSACGSVVASHVLTGATGSPNPGDVQLYMQGQAYPEGFREIAIVQATGHGTRAKMPVVIESLRQEAQKLGCNALVNIRIDKGASTTTANAVCVAYP